MEMSTQTQASASDGQPTPAVEQPWPRSDFEKQFQRLRGELESAVRVEKSKAQEIAGLQDLSFTRGIPASVLAGGQDKLEKLAHEQDAAKLAVQKQRAELRAFVDTERARFFTLKNDARRRLNPEITAQFARAQAAAGDLTALLREWLGTKNEIALEETQISVWNKIARNLNRLIPAENVNNVPAVGLIDLGESLRSSVAGMLVADRDLRDLVRFFLARDADARQRAAAHSEFLEQQSRIGTIDDPSFDHRV